MPTETKNSTAKASRSGSVSEAARWLSSDLAQHHAGEECAERERDVEQHRRAEGDAERDGEHGQAEQLARAGMGHVMQDPGITRLPTISMMATKAATLPRVIAIGRASANKLSVAPAFSTGASAGNSTSVSTIAMSSTISQPTAMRPRSVSSKRRSCIARSSTTVLATDKARPNTTPALIDQPSHHASPMPSAVATAICAMAPGMRDAPDREQVFEREMQADAEHQQDHTDLGELVRDALVGDVSRA